MDQPEQGSACPTPPFATPDDLAARWHELSPDEERQAKVLLDDASDIIIAAQPDWDTVREATLKRVTCQMVKRAMLADSLGVGVGVTQVNQTTGPFTDGMTFANPTGDLYLLDSEKRSLGVGRQQAFHMHMEGCAHDTG